jgi:hypothetical protein
LVRPVPLVLWVTLVHLGQLGHKEERVQQDPLANRVTPELLDRLEVLDSKEPLECPEQLDSLVPVEQLVLLEFVAKQVTLVQLAARDLQVPLDKEVPPEKQDSQEVLDQLDKLEHQEHRDSRDLRDHLESLEHLDSQAALEHLVSQASVDQPASPVNKVKWDNKDSLVTLDRLDHPVVLE